jgi:hypothetical protein
VSGYGLDDRAIEIRFPADVKRTFILVSVSRPALGSTQPLVQWLPGVLSLGGKAWPGRDADHSHPSSAEVIIEELYLLSSRCLQRCVVRLFLLTNKIHSELFLLLSIVTYLWNIFGPMFTETSLLHIQFPTTHPSYDISYGNTKYKWYTKKDLRFWWVNIITWGRDNKHRT